MGLKGKDDVILRELESEFAEMESRFAKGHPGIAEVLKVYGDYEAALNQVNAYFAALTPEAHFSTSSSTSIAAWRDGDLE